MLKIREIVVGEGMPKICAPIVEKSQDVILEMAQNLNIPAVDIIEWRLDHYDNVDDINEVLQTASLLRSVVNDKPVLATFRTSEEGGERTISPESYSNLMMALAESGDIDMLDIQAYFMSEESVTELVSALGKLVFVVGSYHDFDKTPSEQEIIDRLLYMAHIGVDIPKIAVMPQCKEDVLRLMNATNAATSQLVDIPVISMSMAGMGAVSRIAGESFGSSVTFGCLGKPSAPGQINIYELKHTLELIHQQ